MDTPALHRSRLTPKQALLVATVLSKAAGQPRWPAGSPKGGQFRAGPGGGGGFGGGIEAPQFGISGGWAAGPGIPVPKNPTTPTDPRNAANPEDVAVFVKGHDPGPGLNGIPFSRWSPPRDWNVVEGQNPNVDAGMGPLDVPPGKHAAAGVVVEEPDGRVWVVEPTNHFGGYQHSYPKGTAEPEIQSLQANAIKEAWEESGLKVEITGVVGDYERSTSVARFYTARRVAGSPADYGAESQSVKLVPTEQLADHLNRSIDRKIASDYLGYDIAKRSSLTPRQAGRVAWIMRIAKAKKGPAHSQPRWPAGTSWGGRFKPSYSAGGAAAMVAEGRVFEPALATGKNPNNSSLVAANGKIKTYAERANAGDTAYFNDPKNKPLFKEQGMNSYQTAKWVNWVEAKGYAEAKAGFTNKPAASGGAGGGLDAPVKLSTMEKVGAKPGGSADGALYKDTDGQTWLVKGYKDSDQAKAEVLASKVYKAAGVGAPEQRLVDLEGKHGNGEIGVMSRWEDNLTKFDTKNKGHMEAVQSGFAAAVLTRDWDAIGMSYDNAMIRPDGTAIQVDPGASFMFRAQGEMKPGGYPDTATEWTSMRDPKVNEEAAAVYGKMTAEQLVASADKVRNIDDATLKGLAEKYGPGDAAARKALGETMIARRDHIAAQADSIKSKMTPPKPKSMAADDPELTSVKVKPAAPKAGQVDIKGHEALAAKELSGFKAGEALAQIETKGPTHAHDIKALTDAVATNDPDIVGLTAMQTDAGKVAQAAALVSMGGGDVPISGWYGKVEGTHPGMETFPASTVWATAPDNLKAEVLGAMGVTPGAGGATGLKPQHDPSSPDFDGSALLPKVDADAFAAGNKAAGAQTKGPIRDVKVADLVGNQSSLVVKEPLKHYMDNPDAITAKPLYGLQLPDGKVALLDGHHRAEAALRLGIDNVKVEVLGAKAATPDVPAPKALSINETNKVLAAANLEGMKVYDLTGPAFDKVHQMTKEAQKGNADFVQNMKTDPGSTEAAIQAGLLDAMGVAPKAPATTPKALAATEWQGAVTAAGFSVEGVNDFTGAKYAATDALITSATLGDADAVQAVNLGSFPELEPLKSALLDEMGVKAPDAGSMKIDVDPAALAAAKAAQAAHGANTLPGMNTIPDATGPDFPTYNKGPTKWDQTGDKGKKAAEFYADKVNNAKQALAEGDLAGFEAAASYMPKKPGANYDVYAAKMEALKGTAEYAALKGGGGKAPDTMPTIGSSGQKVVPYEQSNKMLEDAGLGIDVDLTSSQITAISALQELAASGDVDGIKDFDVSGFAAHSAPGLPAFKAALLDSMGANSAPGAAPGPGGAHLTSLEVDSIKESMGIDMIMNDAKIADFVAAVDDAALKGDMAALDALDSQLADMPFAGKMTQYKAKAMVALGHKQAMAGDGPDATTAAPKALDWTEINTLFDQNGAGPAAVNDMTSFDVETLDNLSDLANQGHMKAIQGMDVSPELQPLKDAVLAAMGGRQTGSAPDAAPDAPLPDGQGKVVGYDVSDSMWVNAGLPIQSDGSEAYKAATKIQDAGVVGDLDALHAVDTAGSPQVQAFKDAMLAEMTGQAGTGTTAPKVDTALLDNAIAAKPSKAAMTTPSNPNVKLMGKVDQVDAIAKQVQAGTLSAPDAIAQIQAIQFGKNTYNKKGQAFADNVVAALGGYQAAGKAAVTATTAPSTPKPKPKAITPDRLPTKPAFDGSSKQWLNEQNQKIASDIEALALKGDLDAIDKYTFPELDKESGNPTGKTLTIATGHSVTMKSYAQQLKEDVNLLLNPPPTLEAVKAANKTATANVSALAGQLKPLKGSLDVQYKAGFYPVVGKVSQIDAYNVKGALHYKKNLSSTTYSAESKKSWPTLDNTLKSALSSYTGNSYGPINDSFRAFGPSAKAKSADRGLRKMAYDLKPGTMLSRKIDMHGGELTNFLEQAEGKVITELGISSTSIRPTTWSGNIQLRMVTSEGVQGAWVGYQSKSDGSAISKNPSEDEILLPAGAEMLVTRIQKSSEIPSSEKSVGWGEDVHYVVDVVVLPTKPAYYE